MADLTRMLNDQIEAQRDDLDWECLQLVERNPNMMIPWYLMAAYAYYVEDSPIISDLLFDKLAERMYNNWDQLEHKHKDMLDQDQLKAGTYLGKYPEHTKGALSHLRTVYEKFPDNRKTRGRRNR